MSLDLRKEIKAGNKIYVRNKSVPRGALFLTLYDMGNRPIQIQIPPTPHPFCLSDVSTEYAMDEGGLNLRMLLNKGIVKLVSQAKAEEILKDPSVRAELKAAVESTMPTNDKTKAYRNKRDPSTSLAQASGVNPETGMPLVIGSSGLHANAVPDAPIRFVADEDDEDSNVNPQLRVVVAQLASKEVTSKDAKHKISQFADQLKEGDLAYLAAQTSGQVRDYAQSLIARLRGLDDDDDDDDDDDNTVADSEDEAATPRVRQHLNVGADSGNRTLDPSMLPADLVEGVQARAHGNAFDPVTQDADDDDIEDEVPAPSTRKRR